jgi:hypothetical protein
VFVFWEEPIDHDRTEPYPNATRSQVRVAISRDGGTAWDEPSAIADLLDGYASHPEVAVGPDGFVHVLYRISIDQGTLTSADPLGYRSSTNYGLSWREYEIAVDDPTRESHPFNLVATRGFVHAASARGVYTRRPLP